MSDRHSLVGMVIQLGALPPFRSLSHRRLAALAYEGEVVMFERDAWVLRSDEAVTSLHVVLEGHLVDLSRPPAMLLGPGALVGFPDLFVAGPTGAAVRTEGEAVTFRIETDAIRDLCERDFISTATLLGHLADRVAADPVSAAAASETGGSKTGGSASAPIPTRLDRVGRMIALARAAPFGREHMDALAELAGQVDVERLRPGDVLHDGSGPPDRYRVIVEGAVSLVHPDRQERRLAPGATPGLVEALASRAPDHTAQAAEETTVLTVPMDPFLDVLEDHFELAFTLIAWLSGLAVGLDRDQRIPVPNRKIADPVDPSGRTTTT